MFASYLPNCLLSLPIKNTHIAIFVSFHSFLRLMHMKSLKFIPLVQCKVREVPKAQSTP
jgi:hypothetical protein